MMITSVDRNTINNKTRVSSRVHTTVAGQITQISHDEMLLNHMFDSLEAEGLDQMDIQLAKQMYSLGYAYFPDRASYMRYNERLGYWEPIGVDYVKAATSELVVRWPKIELTLTKVGLCLSKTTAIPVANNYVALQSNRTVLIVTLHLRGLYGEDGAEYVVDVYPVASESIRQLVKMCNYTEANRLKFSLTPGECNGMADLFNSLGMQPTNAKEVLELYSKATPRIITFLHDLVAYYDDAEVIVQVKANLVDWLIVAVLKAQSAQVRNYIGAKIQKMLVVYGQTGAGKSQLTGLFRMLCINEFESGDLGRLDVRVSRFETSA